MNKLGIKFESNSAKHQENKNKLPWKSSSLHRNNWRADYLSSERREKYSKC